MRYFHKKRIVISSNTSWYIYNFRLSLMKSLVKNGFEVVVVAPWDDYSAKLQDAGYEVFPIPLNSKRINPFSELKTVYSYFKAYSTLSPAVVLHNTAKPNIYGSVVARILDIPCINNITGLGTAFMRKGILNHTVKNLYWFSQRSASKVFFQNRDDMNIFLESGIVRRDQAGLLPGSGIELDRYAVSPKPMSQSVTFLLIARLIFDKGIQEYADAARIIKAKYPNTEFELLGYVDYNNPTAIPIEQIQEWEKEGVLKWINRQEDVRPFISNVDCVVLPSYREGTPRTLLEAASMAKPIIAADAIGCKEPVESGVTGLLCRPKDAQDLSEKMDSMIQMGHQKRIYMGQQGRQKMEREFDISIVIDNYIKEINALLSR